VLQSQYATSLKIFNASALIAADMKSLVSQLEWIRDNFTVSSMILHYASSDLPPICINENYFATFDALIGDVIFDDVKLSESVLEWYTKAKSYVDQIKYNNDHVSKMSDAEKIQQIESHDSETKDLINSGHQNIINIQKHAAIYHKICVQNDRQINQILLKE
jgi:hypothetical protein